MNNTTPLKKCSKCQESLPVTDFFVERKRSDGRYPICKECRKVERVGQIERYKQRHGPKPFKFCNCCKTEKPSSAFYRNRSCSSGLKPLCKECEKERDKPNREKMIAKLRQWAIDHPEQDKKNRKNRYFKGKYGITLDERDALIEAQHGRCAICNEVAQLSSKPQNGRQDALCVDHCHKTGKVRGLLCNGCNTALGHFKDSEEILQQAIDYLRRYRE